MIRRDLHAGAFNAICNHPSVRPYVGGTTLGALDATVLVMDWRNVLLMGHAGGVLAVWQGDGVFEMHVAFLPEMRGADAEAFGRDVLAVLFGEMGAERVFGRFPVRNRRVVAYARAMGFRPMAEEASSLGVWRGETVPVRTVEMTRGTHAVLRANEEMQPCR